MDILLFCAAVLVLLFAALSFNVSRQRRRSRRLPAVTEADVTKAIRAHSNAAEYVPLFVALLLYAHAQHLAPGAYWIGVALIATTSRVAHAVGMLVVASVAERHPLRFIGALGTYIGLFAAGGALLLRACQT